MEREFKKLGFVIVFVFCTAFASFADWTTSDGHKMHFPQYPDPCGWDVDVREYELADDWGCTETGPVSDIHFWVSWKNDVVWDILSIQANIYSDDPVGPGGSDPCNIYSKPGELLWSRTFSYDKFYVNPNPGLGNQGFWITHPYNPTLYYNDHQKYWQINITDINNPFTQQQGAIYWLGLKVPATMNYLGWKTSLDSFMDKAVVNFPSPQGWSPLSDPRDPQHMPINFAFVITGGEAQREACCLPDGSCDNLTPSLCRQLGGQPQGPGTVCQGDLNGNGIDDICEGVPRPKWLQRPDLSANGLDVMASEPLILADDFECRQTTRITDITVWGSWKGDALPPNGPNDVRFTLSIHSDIPDPNPYDPNNHSMPGRTLWYRDFMPGTFEVSIEQQGIPEGWYDPYYYEYFFPGDYTCWKYVFHIPETEAFCQQGEPNMPVIYWLDVQAEPNQLASSRAFGWKTSINHWNDDAVWTYGSEPYIEWWYGELRYPYGHPYESNSIDLAFAIDGNKPCTVYEPKPPVPHLKWSQPPIEIDPIANPPIYCGWDEPSHLIEPGFWKVVADDFRCLGTMPVTSIHWWGSHVGWEGSEPPPQQPIAWRIGFWSNVPAVPAGLSASPASVNIPDGPQTETVHSVRAVTSTQLTSVSLAGTQVNTAATTGECFVACPPGATNENEPNCGLPNDTVNGGCNSDPPVFSPISCGETVCGTAAFDGNTRDTDWYEIVITEDTQFTWTVKAEFSVAIGLVEMNPVGSGNCSDVTGQLNPYAAAGECNEVSITTGCLPAGTYWFFAAPDFSSTFECGKDYVATLTCVPCGARFSYPETLLWQIEVPADRVDINNVGRDYFPNRPSDTCFQYYVQLDPNEYFWQNKTPDNTFWMSITAIYDGPPPNNVWGWKTRPWHWMDDAVTFWLDGPFEPGITLNPTSNNITPLEGPEGSYDAAFELDTDPNWIKWEQPYTGLRNWDNYTDIYSTGTEYEGQLHINSMAADDWLCKRRTPVSAVVWWGSYMGYQYLACQGQPESPPVKPDYFLLNIWTDVPVGDPCNIYVFSHPGRKVWEYKARDYDEVMVGYDESQPMGAGAAAGTPLNEPVFRYSVRLSEENWFCQPDVNSVYWLGIVAVWDGNEPWNDYSWGWTNHQHVFGDDGVQGWPDYYDPNSWYWNEIIDWQTGESRDLSFMLFTEPDYCCECANFNLDTIVNFKDYAELADDWLWTGPTGGYITGDLNCDGSVDFYDLKIFAEQWLDSCP